MKLRALWALNYLCWYLTFLPTVLLVVDLVALLWLRISEHRDRPFRLIVTGHFANA